MMILTISQVYGLITYAYKGLVLVYDGFNNSRIETSNKLFKAFSVKGKDDFLDIITVKQIYKYNRIAFDKITKTVGFMFIYQTHLITLRQDRKGLRVSALSLLTGLETPSMRLTATSIRNITLNDCHRDISDSFNGLLKVMG